MTQFIHKIFLIILFLIAIFSINPTSQFRANTYVYANSNIYAHKMKNIVRNKYKSHKHINNYERIISKTNNHNRKIILTKMMNHYGRYKAEYYLDKWFGNKITHYCIALISNSHHIIHYNTWNSTKYLLYSKPLISVLSFFGGASIISLIDAYESRRQHQEDITIKEIRKFTNNLRKYNDLFSERVAYLNNNNNEIINVLIAIMCYISSWSVNVKFKRIDSKMLIYSSRTLLEREYKMLKDLLHKCLAEGNKNHYYDAAKRTKNFFVHCDIINMDNKKEE